MRLLHSFLLSAVIASAFVVNPHGRPPGVALGASAPAAPCSPVPDFSAGAPIDAPLAAQLGIAPPGNYRVHVAFRSARRYADVVNDGGHCGHFCPSADVDYESCEVRRAGFDGVALSPDSVSDCGSVVADAVTLFRIEGPHQNDEGKWEWDDCADGKKSLRASDFACGAHFRRGCSAERARWTLRDTPLLDASYLVQWNGSAIEAGQRVRWTEDDPSTFDDNSLYYEFDVGSAVTRCLREGPAVVGGELVIALPSDDQFVDICSDAGGCASPKHYRIRAYYYVTCRSIPLG